MKKKLLIALFALFQMILNIPSVYADEDYIERKILIDISWQQNNDGTIINLEYIQAKKVGNHKAFSDRFTSYIYADDLKFKDNLTIKDINNYIESNGDTGFVYNSDEVFGNYIKIFADVSDKKRSDEELQSLTKDAIKNVNKLYEQKDAILSGKVEISEGQTYSDNDGQNPYFLTLVIILMSLAVIGILRGIFNKVKKKKIINYKSPHF